MDRLYVVLVVLGGLSLIWIAWQGAKYWLRRRIRVAPEMTHAQSPTLVYFSGADCAPCRFQQQPIVDSLRQLMGSRIQFHEYDATEHPDLAQRYKVLTVPTTVVIAPDGEVVAVNYGVTPADRLRRQLDRAAGIPN
jgi:thioredoxin-like negative regulator of GroEL